MQCMSTIHTIPNPTTITIAQCSLSLCTCFFFFVLASSRFGSFYLFLTLFLFLLSSLPLFAFSVLLIPSIPSIHSISVHSIHHHSIHSFFKYNSLLTPIIPPSPPLSLPPPLPHQFTFPLLFYFFETPDLLWHIFCFLLAHALYTLILCLIRPRVYLHPTSLVYSTSSLCTHFARTNSPPTTATNTNSYS